MKSVAVQFSWPLATALLVLFGRSDGLAQNLATNPGFEAGNTAGWFAFGSPTISAVTAQAHAGTFSALVTNRTATYMGIAQAFQGVLIPGETYNISAWVRLASGANQTVNLTMQKVDAAGTTYATVASSSVSANNWSQLSGQYTLNVSGSLTSLVFYAEVTTSANAAYYFDDVNIEAEMPVPTTNGQCTVNWTNVFQRIDGFGASSAWRSTWSSSVANQFFSTNTGIGLSLLRTRIAPDGTTVENSLMQMARDRGAKVWSTPWSPPTAYKTTNSVNGGYFVSSAANYQGYASQLARYVVNMKNTYGVTIHALSVQNEPNYITTYESCGWSAQQIHDFIPYLSATLAASNVASTKIMLPESANWDSAPGLYTTTMTDATTAPLVSIIASHNYVANNNAGDQTAPAALNSYGAALWETEVSTFDAFDGSITNGIYWAKRIHAFLTIAQVNAWHYWWLSGANNEGLANSSDVLAKRAYAVGQFSRFVRPDFYRIGVVSNTGPLQISAYKEPTNGAVAIVVINSSTNAVAQTFNLSGFSVTNVTPWLTSASASLASQSLVAVNGPTFTNTIPPLSIVTFVGQIVVSNSEPTNITLSNSTLGENQPPATPVGNLTTADPDLGNAFTYTLVAGTGSGDNASFTISGTSLLTAASFNHEAQNSFSIRIRSTDQGALFTEKVFTINVTNINEPPSDIALANASVAENQSPGASVGGLSTADPDSGNMFIYTLVAGAGGTDNGLFSVSGSNLLTAASFNYEVQNSFSVRIRSTDQGGASTEKAFVFTVTDLNEAPELVPVSDVTVGAGVMVTLTNSASDPDLPVQTLTFSLLGGSPVNSSLNASNGIFTWRPLVSQAGTTNPVTVTVADNGSPSLSATNSFTVAVSPLNPPTFTSISVNGAQVMLDVNGPLGPDYIVWSATNLADWQSVLTNTPGSLPFSIILTNTEPQRYYRLQLGP
jgi:O-glycosyl hydrolase